MKEKKLDLSMSVNGAHDNYGAPPDFQWKSEFDTILLNLANSDYDETDWNKLREIIKYKLDQNIASFMADPPPSSPPPVPVEPHTDSPDSNATTLSPGSQTPSGIKFPPFPKKVVNEFTRNEYNSHGRSKTVLTEEEAKSAKDDIWRQLHDFEGNPPFTIQRVCELLIQPRSHYKSTGRYLRAFERALLVTSTTDAFPIIPPEDQSVSASMHTYSPAGSLREATTPLFSPIPFLHEDARSRSRSRSPPMSPLQLAAAGRSLSPGADEFRLGGAASVAVVDPVSVDALAVEGDPIIDGPVIGLVDELDDPSPGHLSDHPTALTATTSKTPEPATNVTPVAAPSKIPVGKPMFGGSLRERFVKASSTEENPQEGQASSNAPPQFEENDSMAVDEPDADKENINKG